MQVVAYAEILDKPRPEARAVLRALTRDLHLKVFMVTGGVLPTPSMHPPVTMRTRTRRRRAAC